MVATLDLDQGPEPERRGHDAGEGKNKSETERLEVHTKT